MTQVRRTIAFAMVPEAVLYAKVPAEAKLLWAILARHADTEWRCYPSLKRLAELMDCSEQTVRRAKAKLVAAKLIEVHQRYAEDGRRTSDDIVLLEGIEPRGVPNGRGDPSTAGTYPPIKNGRAYKEDLTKAISNESAGVRAQADLKRPAREARIVNGGFHRAGDLD